MLRRHLRWAMFIPMVGGWGGCQPIDNASLPLSGRALESAADTPTDESSPSPVTDSPAPNHDDGSPFPEDVVTPSPEGTLSPEDDTDEPGLPSQTPSAADPTPDEGTPRPSVTPSDTPEPSPLESESPTPIDDSTPFPDMDGDGFSSDLDCDDADPAVFPGADDVCNGTDDDCDGVIDELGMSLWYIDSDGDGFGTTASTTESCSPPVGFSAVDGDCDDQDPTTYPGALEPCDGIDHNCNGSVGDESLVVYRDWDGDGFGADGGQSETACDDGSGWARYAYDCNDFDAVVHPLLVDGDAEGASPDGSIDAPFSLIGDAVGQAYNPCGRVLVEAALYVESIHIENRVEALEIIGLDAGDDEEEPRVRAPDGERVLTIDGSSAIAVEGLKLEGQGVVDGDGGIISIVGSIFISLSDLVIEDGEVNEENDGYGGGVFVDASDDVVFEALEVSKCAAYRGGAMALRDSDVLITDSSFTENEAGGSGGALAVIGADGDIPSALVVEFSTFDGNQAQNSGGAVYIESGLSVSFADSLLTYNTANSGNGGAIRNPTEIVRSTFFHNKAEEGTGGALQLLNSSSVTNSIFGGNRASQGGAIAVRQSSRASETFSILNDTLVDNDGASAQSIYIENADTFVLSNTIIMHNADEMTCAVESDEDSLDYTISYNDIALASGDAFCGSSIDEDNENSIHDNITDNPLFVDYTPYDYFGADFHLSPDSPCVDSGNPELGSDPDGSPIDRGAYGGPDASE